MIIRDIKETLKNTIEMRDVLKALNINLPGHGNKIKCFAHEEKNPSMQIYQNRVYCFTCQFSEDLFGVTSKVLNLSFPDSIKWLASQFMPGLQFDGHIDYEAIAQIKLQRAASEGLQIWRNNTYHRLCELFRATQEAKRTLKPDTIGFFVACQLEGPLDYLTDILNFGNELDWSELRQQMEASWGYPGYPELKSAKGGSRHAG
ncbi:MAG: hypothetical protein FIA99_08665 [Ruminiclostridium sp.]|nr:hypothetical protein [Ruminiclostridium sp.]